MYNNIITCINNALYTETFKPSSDKNTVEIKYFVDNMPQGVALNLPFHFQLQMKPYTLFYPHEVRFLFCFVFTFMWNIKRKYSTKWSIIKSQSDSHRKISYLFMFHLSQKQCVSVDWCSYSLMHTPSHRRWFNRDSDKVTAHFYFRFSFLLDFLNFYSFYSKK